MKCVCNSFLLMNGNWKLNSTAWDTWAASVWDHFISTSHQYTFFIVFPWNPPGTVYSWIASSFNNSWFQPKDKIALSDSIWQDRSVRVEKIRRPHAFPPLKPCWSTRRFCPPAFLQIPMGFNHVYHQGCTVVLWLRKPGKDWDWCCTLTI